MNKYKLLAFALFNLSCASLALAQAPGEMDQPTMSGIITRTVPLIIILGFLCYWLLIKPQKDKLQAQQTLLNDLKRGDQILTSGGLYGRVAEVDKDYILVEIAANVRVRLDKAHVAQKIEKTAAAEKNSTAKAAN